MKKEMENTGWEHAFLFFCCLIYPDMNKQLHPPAAMSSPLKWAKSWAKNRPCFPLSCSCQVFDHRQQRQKLLMQYLFWSDLQLVHSTSRRWIQSSLNYMYLKWRMWLLINKLNWRFESRKAKTQANINHDSIWFLIPILNSLTRHNTSKYKCITV